MKRKLIEYKYRNKVKLYMINRPIEQGFIRLDSVEINPDKHSSRWVKYNPENWIREYKEDSVEYKTVIKIWWLAGRKYTKIKYKSYGTDHIKQIYKQTLKELNIPKELYKRFG